MSTIAEIEEAIEKLPAPQVEELAGWLEELRLKRAAHPAVDRWLQGSRGAAISGVTTQGIMAMSRGEE